MSNGRPTLLILGTRGIPANHGGFETFAEKLAVFLAGRWDVKVYCQHEVERVTERFRTETWNGIELINVQVASTGPRATLEFDLHCILHSARQDGVCLVLGYNSAIFMPILRLFRRPILTNMDGIEWRRPKWSRAVRAWFWVNEWIAAWSSHRLVADHPAIADHLATRRPRRAIVTIPYGGNPVTAAPEAPIRALGLEPDRYMVSIARIEPDNNVLTIVEAFSRRRRHMKLMVLGTLDDRIPYHRAVREAASDEVAFPGGIYEQATIGALRFHARAYLHGYTVGGTNPSLVESLWAGCPVIAHDNPFNRGTAGDGQAYFSSVDDCERRIEECLAGGDGIRARREHARRQAQRFSWEEILACYESELMALGGYTERLGGAIRLEEAAGEGRSVRVAG